MQELGLHVAKEETESQAGQNVCSGSYMGTESSKQQDQPGPEGRPRLPGQGVTGDDAGHHVTVVGPRAILTSQGRGRPGAMLGTL